MIATTIEQSNRLMECGISPETAEFYWMDDSPNEPRLVIKSNIIEENNPYILAPAWSMTALSQKLRKGIKIESSDFSWLTNPLFFTVGQMFPFTDDFGVVARDVYYPSSDVIIGHDKSPVEALVQAIEWLAKYGHKFNQ